MKVAITGASGLLGRYVCHQLRAVGHQVIAIGRTPSPKLPTIDFRAIDYSTDSLREILRENVDACVHLAGVRSSASRFELYSPNVTLTGSVIEAASQAGIPHVLVASSIAVYAGNPITPWREGSKTRPTSSYGLSKLLGEQVASWFDEIGPIRTTILRFGHLYGAFENNDYMVNVFLRRAAEGRPLRVHQGATGGRDMIYAGDAARAILCSLIADAPHRIYNIGSDQPRRVIDVANTITEVFGSDVQLTANDDWAPVVSLMDSSRAHNELGWLEPHSMLEAMREIRASMEVGHLV